MILVNGIQSEHVRVSDRGLSYGDGVFRTLLVREYRPLCWPRHYDKLYADCAALDIVCPAEAILAEEMAKLIAGTPDCVLKVIVTRGESQRGYAIPEHIEPTRILMASPVPQYPASYLTDGVRLHLCSTRLANQPLLAGIKHLNRLENVLARREWNTSEIAEGLMLDMEGNAIEGTMSNLFLLQGKTLHTPDLGRCGVAGVQRERIMDLAGRLGMTVRVENLPLARIYDADELVLCNSIIGVWQARELAGKIWPTGKLAARLRSLLDDDGH
ncbi:MAG: aminodeoxychorismate lyase [Betaproteobacteria bacterium CG2_30_59_46]|nr:MAG: aminodeoxychorismate lyase [Betaproteobacteria bacterium CG2_30_59_46]PIQ12926.1 MAG: aminodeoxychorismate lyase [Hydrogenophilales bacterium CG18_big_fil_WC_8_21_14_2_50_58_12]PIX99485.1 MAG: aminodeoxychorismate lyase [Hydrogenophilales bacterium CG_4_10_14_3_um_filter_58_23]PJB08063.1 MAG: aminodeoxychorismate lyase [Hydrogenophilales bacterium CG_4_9_14_3_um_filter_59_35]